MFKFSFGKDTGDLYEEISTTPARRFFTFRRRRARRRPGSILARTVDLYHVPPNTVDEQALLDAYAEEAGITFFGKRRRRHRRRSCKKIPAKILKMCKRLKIKTTRKVGNKRVRKTIKELMKQIKNKMRK